jgi:hypothetical protein
LEIFLDRRKMLTRRFAAERDDHTAAALQLPDQGGRHVAAGGGHYDAIERCGAPGRPTHRATPGFVSARYYTKHSGFRRLR